MTTDATLELPPPSKQRAEARTPGAGVSDLVDATPATRERTVDFVRALCIVVVVLWHWVFSLTQWDRSGRLVVPNLIGQVPGLWLATWVLQVMPAFFVVGGYSNLASWQSVRRDGQGALVFWRRRLRRLLRPAGALIGLWTVLELLLVAVGGPRAGVLRWGMVTFVPLWFLGVYCGVVLLVPLTARLHDRCGATVPVVLAGAMVVAGRGLLTTALVWVFAHQLGYFWRDGTLTRGGRPRERRIAGGLLAAGTGGLALLTTAGHYPVSMVATSGEASSNMMPTTICIAALAVVQLGLLLLLRPALERCLRRRAVWGPVVALNGVAMTIFCWHMTADVAVITGLRAVGARLGTRPDASWWVGRPFWLLAPAAVLAVLVALFSRIERG